MHMVFFGSQCDYGMLGFVRNLKTAFKIIKSGIFFTETSDYRQHADLVHKCDISVSHVCSPNVINAIFS